MEFLYTPVFINVIWVGAAFLFGFVVRQVGLPPMIGFLLAGFSLNFMGLTEGSLALDSIADMGVMLLLFTVGLKLDIRGLAKPEIWAGTTIHCLLSVLFFGLIIMVAGTLGCSMFAGLDMAQAALAGFALSFSSTIFAIKILEDKGELSSAHANLAIGVLIMQDILAVVFITLSKGQFPSLWALGLPVFLLVIRPVLMFFIDRAGHGEMLTLAGFFTAIVVGATSFHLVGMKADLGALTMGILVGSHPRASELAKSLYSFKDMFLVGFFFQIGLVALPHWTHLFLALALVVVLVVKSCLFFFIFTRFRVRARTSFLATLSLSNYSEFGLIVASIAGSKGWLGNDWLLIIALALTISFIIVSPLNLYAGSLYDSWASRLRRFENVRSRERAGIHLDEACFLVLGLGRIGMVAYDTMREKYGDDRVVGIDQDGNLVERLVKSGRRVIHADVSDQEFWRRVRLGNVKLVMLAIPVLSTSLFAIKQLKTLSYSGKITAIAEFDDEAQALREAGADSVYNVLAEAGAGYALHICQALNEGQCPAEVTLSESLASS